MTAKTLLPEQDALLRELVDEYEQMGDRPQIRVGQQGRTGSRVWMWGARQAELTGKRKLEDFAELRANGDLRQVKKDQTGTWYAITPAGLKRCADLVKMAAANDAPAVTRKSGPPPALLTTAPSRVEVLRMLVAETRIGLDALLAVSAIAERHPNDGSGPRVITPHPWTWLRLRPEDQRRVGIARKALDAWTEAASGAIRASAPERIEDFSDHGAYLVPVVERSSRGDGPTAPDMQRVQQRVHAALDGQLMIVEELPSAHEPPATVLVPDTNALIFNPAIETWNVGNDRIAITVLPQVIAELDGKKMDRKIGERASSLIRRFKEFDRRGNTLVGVPVVGKVRFREVALDSAFDGAPSWLNKRNADDRVRRARSILRNTNSRRASFWSHVTATCRTRRGGSPSRTSTRASCKGPLQAVVPTLSVPERPVSKWRASYSSGRRQRAPGDDSRSTACATTVCCPDGDRRRHVARGLSEARRKATGPERFRRGVGKNASHDR